MHNQQVEVLKRFPLLAGFTDTELEALETLLDYRTLSGGEVLFHEGDMSHEIYFIQRGTVEICKADATGRQHFVIATREARDIVGELAFLDGSPRSALVRTVGETEIIVLDKRELIQLPYSLIFFNRLISNIALVSSQQLRNSTEKHVKSLEQQLEIVRLQKMSLGNFLSILWLSWQSAWLSITCCIRILILSVFTICNF